MSRVLPLAAVLSLAAWCISTADRPTAQQPTQRKTSTPSDDERAPEGRARELAVEVQQVTSTTVQLRWPSLAKGEEVRVLVAPEPAGDAEVRPPAATALQRLPGDSSGYRATGLAPATSLFFRIEADTEDGPKVATVHARTKGGPRAELDDHVREVHMVAPDVLHLVLTGGHGPTWATRHWKIQRVGGERIDVRKVHRHSVPVAQPDYEVGYGGREGLETVKVDHHIYVELADAVGSPQVLRIQGPNGAHMLWPFSDRYAETPVIQLNQVGYAPNATRRYAYVSRWMGDGGALALDGFPPHANILLEPGQALEPATVAHRELPIAERTRQDVDAGGPVKQIDLSQIEESSSAVYRVHIPGVGVSWPTRVSAEAVQETYRIASRGLFHNRWGTELSAKHTQWSRPSAHEHVYTSEQGDAFSFVPENTPKRGKRRLKGGYHDAGDFDQRPTHTVVPQLLMRAYELNPDAFGDDELGIPESGNGIPDLLDEALWGISTWAQLQESHGGVRAGVESHRHPWGIYFAHQDPLPYWAFACDANVTARAAGLFAQAARLVEPFDEKQAASLERRAERAWSWATKHDASPSFRLYGASELFRRTGERKYAEAFDRSWDALGQYGAFSRFADRHNRMADYRGDGRVMADYILGYLGHPDASKPIRDTALHWLTRAADGAASATLDSPHAHRNPRPPNQTVSWGEGVVMERHLDVIVARLQLGDLDDDRRRRYLDALSLGADYVLGGNPQGRVYLTGLGARPVREPLHLDSLAFMKHGKPPVPGIPVYGPTDSLPKAGYYRPAAKEIHPDFDEHPRMYRYFDVRSFVVNNEFSVWEVLGPHVTHFAVLRAVARLK